MILKSAPLAFRRLEVFFHQKPLPDDGVSLFTLDMTLLLNPLAARGTKYICPHRLCRSLNLCKLLINAVPLSKLKTEERKLKSVICF